MVQRLEGERPSARHTGDDVDQLVGDGGLATTVVLHGQTVDHVRRVLRRVIHGIPTTAISAYGSAELPSVIHTEHSARKRGPRRESRKWHWQG